MAEIPKLPKFKLAGAINYMLNRWESFARFLECGEVPMDNNAAERAIKHPILGPPDGQRNQLQCSAQDPSPAPTQHGAKVVPESWLRSPTAKRSKTVAGGALRTPGIEAKSIVDPERVADIRAPICDALRGRA